MAAVSILLTGGMVEDKAKKVSDTLRSELKAKKIDARIDYVNLFEVKDLTPYEQDHDVLVNVGTKNVTTNLPVISGTGLLYPWMGTDEMYEEIIKRAV